MNQVHAILTNTTVMIRVSEFSNNTATNSGILTAFKGTFNIFLRNNLAEKFGGAVYMQAGSKLKVSQTEIHNNVPST